MRFDDPNAVNVETHPQTVANGREDHLQVEVVAEDEPQPEHGLEDDDNIDEVEPRQHETSNAWTYSVQKKAGGKEHQEEVDDDNDADGLNGGGVQVGLEIRQPKLWRVPVVHDICRVHDDADGHADGVDGHGNATVVDIALPETRSPTTFKVHFWSFFVKFCQAPFECDEYSNNKNKFEWRLVSLSQSCLTMHTYACSKLHLCGGVR